MQLSTINGLNSSSLNNQKTKENAEISFSEILKSSQVTSDTNLLSTASSAENTPPGDSEFQPKFTTGILPSGHVYTSFNIEDNLTDSDKAYLKSLGWPTAGYSDLNFLASNIAQDRIDGTLKGPLTKEYLFGDKDKDLVGLVDRLQGMGSEFKELCSTLLKIVDKPGRTHDA